MISIIHVGLKADARIFMIATRFRAGENLIMAHDRQAPRWR